MQTHHTVLTNICGCRYVHETMGMEFMRRLLITTVLCFLVLTGCGFIYYASPLRPVDQQGPAMDVADDHSVTYSQGRFEVKLRPVTAAELNRQFASHSQSGRSSTNPFTYGDTEFWEGEEGEERFAVFHMSVKNYAYPKVRIDPARTQIRADNGREYWSLNIEQLQNYFRVYIVGFRGNEYARHQERIDLLRRTLFRSEDIFSGQEAEGYLVFPTLHHDVANIEVLVHDAVLRFDFRGQPAETVDIAYRFERDVERVYPDGTQELTSRN